MGPEAALQFPWHHNARGGHREPAGLQAVPTASSPGTGRHCQEPGSVLSAPPCRDFWTLLRSPRASPLGRAAPAPIAEGPQASLRWAPSSTSLSLLYWEAQYHTSIMPSGAIKRLQHITEVVERELSSMGSYLLAWYTGFCIKMHTSPNT